MTEYKVDNKLGVGEILICNTDTNGKFEPLKYFIGKVIINVGGGGDKIFVIEERDRVSSEVKSIQSRINFNKIKSNTDDYEKLKSSHIATETLIPDELMANKVNKITDFPEINDAKNTFSSMKKTTSNINDDVRETINLEMNNNSNNININYLNGVDKDTEKSEVIINKAIVIENQSNTNFKLIEDPNLRRLVTKSLEGKANLNTNTNNNLIINENTQKENINTGDPNLNPNTNPNPNSNDTNRNKNDDYKANITEINHDTDPNYNTNNMFPPHNDAENLNPALNLKKETNSISEVSSNTKHSDFGRSPIGFVEKEQQIIQIVQGKFHLLKLTMDGKVYGSGQSYFGVVGLGGAKSAAKSTPIPNLLHMNIIQLACGMFHSLALSQLGDLYAWGMGFDGQLGLNSKYKVASSPRYVDFFYKKPVRFIACGHNYSLCITNDCKLWGWGENKLGQLGLGKIQIIDKPTHIELLDLPGNQEGCNKADSLMNNNLDRHYTGRPLSACYISAGYAHTGVVTDEGFLLTFGLNIYGQLGLGNTISTFKPRLIEKDDYGDNLGKIVKVCCNVNGTFIITEEGKLYSCGSKEIGHGTTGMIKLPKLIDSRVYKHVFCNDNSVIAFCPLRILSISPTCGPASGNTILSIIGTAFKEFAKLSVRFIFEGFAQDVKATFDKISRTIFVRTPNFQELCPSIEQQLPSQCKVQVTFDGYYFTEYKDWFMIYPSTIKLLGIEPKCGPIIGGSLLQIKINLDGVHSKFLFSLTCGFQAKPITFENTSKKVKSKRANNANNNSTVNVNNSLSVNKTMVSENLNESKLSEKSQSLTQHPYNSVNVNPMDFANIGSQLDKANWYCCFASYDNGLMTCTIPKIDNFNQNQVEYNVDVAVNGQQFTGFPLIYRFYDIKINKMEPNISCLEGGLIMKIHGTGLFDSLTKKARITSQLGERYSDLQWDRTEKALVLVSNPILWITSDQDVLKNITQIDLYENYIFNVHITMNNLEWIPAASYRYCDPKIERVIYHIFPEGKSKHDRELELFQQEPLTAEEKMFLKIGQYPDDKKKRDEIEKKMHEEDNIINTMYKRPYNGLIIYGSFFPETHFLKVKLVAQTCEQEIVAFYKNRYKIACLIPEIPKLAVGQYQLKIMVSINSQQYFPANKNLLFNAPEYGLTFEDIIKLDEMEAKGGKKVTAGASKAAFKK